MKFKVVQKGKFNLDIPKSEIIKNLSELFDLEENVIEEKFFNTQKPFTLIKDLSEEDAKEYANSLHEAGALASIEIDIDFEDPHPQKNQLKQKSVIDSYLEDNSDKLSISRDAISRDKTFATPIATRRIPKTSAILEERKKAEIQEPSLWNGLVRIGKMRFVLRTFAIIVIAIFMNNILNILLFSGMGQSIFPIILIIFLILGFQLLIFINQRLCDTGQGNTIILSLVLITPFFVSAFEHFNNDVKTIKQYQLSTLKQKQETILANPRAYNIEDKENIEKLIQSKEYEISTSTMDKVFHPVVKYSSYILILMICLYLMTAKGSPSTNIYGDPAKPVDAKNYIISGGFLLILMFSLLTPPFIPNYRTQHSLFSTKFYENFKLINPLPKEFEADYLKLIKK